MKPTIFDNEQYRIYIPFRKSIEFESKLCEANIEYWTDSEMQTASGDIRFYFNKKDAARIEKILKENKIQSADDFKVPSDYPAYQKLYFRAIVLAIALFVIGFIILKVYQILFKDR